MDKEKIMFIKVYNDYTCVSNDNEISKLAHYTDIDALISILKNKELRAKSIMDYQNDDWEGRLSINELYKMVSNNKIIEMTPNQLKILQEKVGNDDRVSEFLNSVPTYVTCFSKNLESNYMIREFVSDATNMMHIGKNIIIIFDAEKLKNDMYVLLPNNEKRYCINMRKIVYDEEKQISIIKNNIKKLWSAIIENTEFNDNEKIRYLLSKIYYLGVCFKKADGVKVSKDEEEVRSFINLIDNRTGKFNSYIPKELETEDRKYRYINIKFCIEDIIEIKIFKSGEISDGKIESIKELVNKFLNVYNHKIDLQIM